MLLDTGYLFAKDEKRIFVNTCLGCSSSCSYCYLPRMGYKNNSTDLYVRKAEDIIAEIQSSPVNTDTLITIGCFSECWDELNKPHTIALIRYFLQQGNQIQLATKRKITIEEASKFKDLITYNGQLCIFVSSATISQWEQIERNTDSPRERFGTFEISKTLDIPTILYMKPVLQGITIQDIETYKQVIDICGVQDVVVGSIFTQEKAAETIHFSDKNELFYNEVSDEVKIRTQLLQQQCCKVYSRSSDVMKWYRERNLGAR